MNRYWKINVEIYVAQLWYGLTWDSSAIVKVKVKCTCCTGTEALYRPYGP